LCSGIPENDNQSFTDKGVAASPKEAGAITSAATFGTQTSASPAVLAESVSVTGEIYCNEPLEGEVNGSIDVTGHLLTIAPPGNVCASVRAGEIDVLGSLRGNVERTEKIMSAMARDSSATFTRAAL
jgi:hypothetical protein